MSAAVQKFIEEVVVHFPRREASEADEVMWVKSMQRNLEGFSAQVLERAAQIIIGTCDRRDFQWLPKQCKEACYEADKVLKAERPRLIGQQPAEHGSTIEDRENFARELLLGEMGRQAAREGWVFGLFTFIRDHMRLPSPTAHCGDKRKMHREHGPCSEVECIKRGSEGVMTALEALYRNQQDILPSKRHEWEAQRNDLISLGEAMLAKREALTKYVQTGVLP